MRKPERVIVPLGAKMNKHEIMKEAESTFSYAVSIARECGVSGDKLTAMQMSGAYRTRRIAAITDSMEAIYDRYHTLFPHMEIEHEMINLNIGGFLNYEDQEVNAYILTAASIWLLDRLDMEGKTEEAYKILPADFDSYGVNVPLMIDTVHPDEVIDAVNYCLWHRHDAIQGNVWAAIVDEGTAKRQRVKSVFSQLLEMISQEEIDRAVDTLECLCDSIIKETLNELNKKSEKYYSLVNELKKYTQPMNAVMVKPSISLEALQRIPEIQSELDEVTKAKYKQAIEIAKMPEAYLDLPVVDPFEVCFALIYLLETGSQKPFLYFPYVSAVSYASNGLPWLEEPADTVEIETYSDLWEDYEEKAGRVYRSTRCLMPRLDAFYAIMEKDLGKKLGPVGASLIHLKSRDRKLVTFHALHAVEPEPEVVEVQTESGDVTAYKEEIRKLKMQLYEARHETAVAKAELDKGVRTHESEHYELIQLRDIIFNLEEHTEETKSDKEYIWPYRPNKTTVIIGGHETWVKNMREKIEGVNFVSREELVNPTVIRNADVVWLQVNAMPHKQYYSVMSICRKNNITPKYFISASAEKSAQQICDNDI